MGHTTEITSASELWFALFVRPQKERSANELLQQKGFETFLPTYPDKRTWADRQCVREKPIFPGYLFCRFDASRRMPILTTPGVLRVVGCGGIPEPIDDSELLAVKRIVASPSRYSPYPHLEVGQRVRILDGPLTGVEGILLELKRGCTLVVSISLMQRSVAVELNDCSVARTQVYQRVAAAGSSLSH